MGMSVRDLGYVSRHWAHTKHAPCVELFYKGRFSRTPLWISQRDRRKIRNEKHALILFRLVYIEEKSLEEITDVKFLWITLIQPNAGRPMLRDCSSCVQKLPTNVIIICDLQIISEVNC